MGLLDGKVVIVTGGGRGIGRQHCLEVGRQGAHVLVVDPGVDLGGDATEDDPATSVAEEIKSLGGSAMAIQASVTQWDDCRAVIQSAIDQFGRMDVVVNNAGILRDRMITSMSEEEFDAVIAVHLKGTFQMTKHACDYWRSTAKSGLGSGGRIINTTSGAGLRGNFGQANYAAAKAGVVALTLVTALEMARYDVTCNAICPIAATRMTTGLWESQEPDGLEASPFDPLHPRTTSPLVAYLASEASSWLSGQVFRVEGGSVVRMEGWVQSSDRYTARTGEYFEAEELVQGMRLAFHTFPSGISR